MTKSLPKGRCSGVNILPKLGMRQTLTFRSNAAGSADLILHVLRSGWGPTPYPMVVGHEIVGKAVRVGSKVEGGIK